VSLRGQVPGSLVVFLVWVNCSSQTLFFGAQMIQGRRAGQELRPARQSGDNREHALDGRFLAYHSWS
jgi:uncharacterized BrkB/YihY/UPF0761 family membrane protein